jgi:hypothetical protein
MGSGGGPGGGSQHFFLKCQAAPLDTPPLQLQEHVGNGPTGHASLAAITGYMGLLHLMGGERLPALPLAATQYSCAFTYFGTSEFSNLGGCQAPKAFGLRPSSAKYSSQVGHLPPLNKHMQFLQHATEFSLVFKSVNRHSQDFVVAE